MPGRRHLNIERIANDHRPVALIIRAGGEMYGATGVPGGRAYVTIHPVPVKCGPEAVTGDERSM